MALAAAVSSSFACRSGEEGITLHPTPANIPVFRDSAFVHSEHRTDSPWLEIAALQGQTIGVEEGASQEMIGLFMDLAIGPEEIVYADWMHQEVRVYGFDGSFKGLVGKRGQGPGEFIFPKAVDIADGDKLLVVGYDGSRIQYFRRQGSAYELEGLFRAATAFSNGDICAMHGHVYTLGYSEELDGVIHKHTLEGALVASFEAPYEHSSPFVRRQLSGRGQLACNKKSRVVGHVNALHSVLTGYSEAGDRIWRVEFANAKRPHVTETKNLRGERSLEYTMASGGEAAAFWIMGSAEADSTFTIAYYTIGEKKSGKRHVFRIDASSGDGGYLGWYPGWDGDVKVPNLLALDKGRLYTVQHRPYPQIGIHDRPNQLPRILCNDAVGNGGLLSSRSLVSALVWLTFYRFQR